MELQARYTHYRHTILLTGTWHSWQVLINTSNSALIIWLAAEKPKLPAEVYYRCYLSFFFFSNTERHFEFPAYSSGGIVMANIEETLHDFTRLVGYHDMKDNHLIIDEMLAPKGQLWQVDIN